MNRRDFLAGGTATVAAVCIPTLNAEPLTATSARMQAFRAMAARVFEPRYCPKKGFCEPLLPEIEAIARGFLEDCLEIEPSVYSDGTQLPDEWVELVLEGEPIPKPVVYNPELLTHFARADAVYDAYLVKHPHRWWMHRELAARHLEKLFPDVLTAFLERDWGDHLTEAEAREQCRWYYTPEVMAELETISDLDWYYEVFWAWDCAFFVDFGLVRPRRQLKSGKLL